MGQKKLNAMLYAPPSIGNLDSRAVGSAWRRSIVDSGYSEHVRTFASVPAIPGPLLPVSKGEVPICESLGSLGHLM